MDSPKGKPVNPHKVEISMYLAYREMVSYLSDNKMNFGLKMLAVLSFRKIR